MYNNSLAYLRLKSTLHFARCFFIPLLIAFFIYIILVILFSIVFLIFLMYDPIMLCYFKSTCTQFLKKDKVMDLV